jgi:hypothetical protein
MFPYKRILSLVLIVFCAVLVFVGCPNETDEEDPFAPLIGESTTLPDVFYSGVTLWDGGYGDYYKFTATEVESYDGGYGYAFTATVKYFGYFTEAKTSGVIIHEYQTGKAPTGFTPLGNFRATYFSELDKIPIVKMGTAANSSAPYECEVTSLEAAKAKFASMDAAQIYCGMPGPYTKQ